MCPSSFTGSRMRLSYPERDQIIIDLGFNNGKTEVLTYLNGQYVISEADRSQKNKARVAADDDCNYLYNEIYTPYSRDRKVIVHPRK